MFREMWHKNGFICQQNENMNTKLPNKSTIHSVWGEGGRKNGQELKPKFRCDNFRQPTTVRNVYAGPR